MKLQEVIENVLQDFYTKHEQGEALLIQDLQDLVDEGYLVPEENSPYGLLEDENRKLKSKLEDYQEESRRIYDLEEEIDELNALLVKFTLGQK